MEGTSNFIAQAYTRMNLEQIRSFILTGSEDKQDYLNEQYSMRLEKASAPIYNRINSLYSNAKELTKATDEISKAVSAFQEVYMEIGMKAGARLLYQLMLEDEKKNAC